MTFTEDLDYFYEHSYALMLIISIEEGRALDTIRELCKKKGRSCMTWDLAEGFQPLAGGSRQRKLKSRWQH